MFLIRLVYRSENAMSVSGARIFVHYHDIVSTARKHNAAANITGFLMFDRIRYHQILEGDAAAVDNLYARILLDKRHRNVELLSREEIPERGFPDWSMGSFLSGRKPHPLQAKHGIAPSQAVSSAQFIRFALDFVKTEPEAA